MLVLLTMLDCLLTLEGVARIGLRYEGNPVCVFLLQVSPLLFIACKVAPAVTAAALIERHVRLRWLYHLAGAVCALAVALNWVMLAMLTGRLL